MYWLVLPLPSFVNAKLLLLTVTTSSNTTKRTVKPTLIKLRLAIFRVPATTNT
jgi:hypothetical protein